jgi:JmjC domain, hydroxylase
VRTGLSLVERAYKFSRDRTTISTMGEQFLLKQCDGICQKVEISHEVLSEDHGVVPFQKLLAAKCTGLKRVKDYASVETFLEVHFEKFSSRPAYYGYSNHADLAEVGFKDEEWSFTSAPTLFQRAFAAAKLNSDGINRASMYYGAHGSVAAIHSEDMHLGSWNYCLHGRKIWVVIPTGMSTRFEDMMQLHHAEGFELCGQYLRHKMIFPSLAMLRKHHIKFYILEQEPSDIVVTFPHSYFMIFTVFR